MPQAMRTLCSWRFLSLLISQSVVKQAHTSVAGTKAKRVREAIEPSLVHPIHLHRKVRAAESQAVEAVSLPAVAPSHNLLVALTSSTTQHEASQPRTHVGFAPSERSGKGLGVCDCSHMRQSQRVLELFDVACVGAIWPAFETHSGRRMGAHMRASNALQRSRLEDNLQIKRTSAKYCCFSRRKLF